MSALADFTLTRTYARPNKHGNKETKEEIVERVASGTIYVIEKHFRDQGKTCPYELIAIKEKMIELIGSFRMSPPGRGLWSMNESITDGRRALALVNCAFLGSDMIVTKGAEFFEQVMSMMMQGVGAGFDDSGADKVMIRQPRHAQQSDDEERTDRLVKFIEGFELTSIKENTDGIKYLSIEKEFVRDQAWCSEVYVIPDSREGWCQAIYKLIQSYIHPSKLVDGKFVCNLAHPVPEVRQMVFDYSLIRPAGKLLKTFGGTASGPQPLIEGIAIIRWLLDREVERAHHSQGLQAVPLISGLMIVDICNVIATIVVAGNVRRSSEIFLSRDEKILGYKNWNDPAMSYRMPWGWASNNSLIVDTDLKDDPAKLRAMYEKVIKHVVLNGEPGLFDIDNARRFNRFIDGELETPNDIDGTNPCGEIGLNKNGETCNLAEVFPSNYVTDELIAKYTISACDMCGAPSQSECEECPSKLVHPPALYREALLDEIVEQIEKDLWYMLLYTKTVTLLDPDWDNTRNIQAKNRRIGISLTGLQKFIAQFALTNQQLAEICSRWYVALKQYDAEISAELGVPLSVALTTIKPSGTISICANVPSGMHCPISEYYIRRVRCGINERALVARAIAAGHHVEPDVMQPDTTNIVTFYVKTSEGIRTRSDYSAKEQFELAHLLQTYWCDNQVSVTITFKPDEVDSLPDLLMKYPLKGVSFLPLNTSVYAQAPEEAITKEQYEEFTKNLKPINLALIPARTDTEQDRYCDGDKCML